MKSDHLVHIQFSPERSLQEQIREHLLDAIRNGIFANNALPSCRKMASMLRVSRNTVVLVYDKLVDEGMLVSKERSGYYACPEILRDELSTSPAQHELGNDYYTGAKCARFWNNRLKHDLSTQRNISKPKNWQDFPYPFVFGQPDHSLFPLNHWRECCRLSQRYQVVKDWISDSIDCDDPALVKQLKSNVLTKRGIQAKEEQILVTIGTQNSLYMLAKLLADEQVNFGVEEPGYPDARNIFASHGANVIPLTLDVQGIEINESLIRCDYVYVTPSHQVPTNVTMPMQRRKALLAAAEKYDFIIIEDDYESEVNVLSKASPSLKSLDTNSRVIYIGSLSKSLSPGLRLGYMVAEAPLISATRALRRLMYRHPPANNQRTCALFISLGYYDTYLRKLRYSYQQRWTIMRDAINQHLPQCVTTDTVGGSAFWLKLPLSVDCEKFVQSANAVGVIVEPGTVHFARFHRDSRRYIRLGYSAIDDDKIELGIKKLASLLPPLNIT
ncbi:GntR family transcriptional regulator [Vibrio sp. 10N.286.49.C2]|uniref:MocR-like pyridoxine biosynthesis transcription factor PdxR n=1 Tax=unclassified Vibrio TaxID=2614977 RepID=UPI000C81BCD9|nr:MULTISPECIES: PLP-dependent aminotransferase family protein [unclassified Vibrio]PMH38112.1 GntR family transcriptional regulator [Vibrio sp. 10N.286.49.C2]PMH53682.1 GntR family transcriptional regulator [Vibrio sp. 10N.286.49.B1]PMH81954.1 GntR family transcriptional regulator [Vibrio sp. 10N.286.48.B7]